MYIPILHIYIYIISICVYSPVVVMAVSSTSPASAARMWLIILWFPIKPTAGQLNMLE